MNPEPEYAAHSRSAHRSAGKKLRYAGIDIIKIVALIFVVTVHSFLHTGFYSTPMTVEFGLFQIFFRWAAFCCVPLFMTVTGYLMCRKKLEPGFYAGVLRVLVIYILISIINVMGQVVYNKATEGTETVIDMAQFGNGIYMVSIVTENGTSVNRIIVNK